MEKSEFYNNDEIESFSMSFKRQIIQQGGLMSINSLNRIQADVKEHDVVMDLKGNIYRVLSGDYKQILNDITLSYNRLQKLDETNEEDITSLYVRKIEPIMFCKSVSLEHRNALTEIMKNSNFLYDTLSGMIFTAGQIYVPSDNHAEYLQKLERKQSF